MESVYIEFCIVSKDEGDAYPIQKAVSILRYFFSFLIFIFLIVGCSNNSEETKPEDSIMTLEGIVLAKQDLKGQKKLLLALDTHNPELQLTLNIIKDLTVEDIIENKEYDLRWLDVKNISKEKVDFGGLKIGSKIRFITENEHLDTSPPTLIAKEITLIKEIR